MQIDALVLRRYEDLGEAWVRHQWPYCANDTCKVAHIADCNLARC